MTHLSIITHNPDNNKNPRHNKTSVIVISLATSLTFNLCTASTYEPNFQEVRSKLGQEGWAPFKFSHRESAKFPVTGEEAELVDAQITEVEVCSMDGGVLCTLWYVKKDRCLMITTRGEGLKNMRIILQVQTSCPEQSIEK